MENPAEFDLNAAVQRWRDRLSQSPNLRVENLDELEAHLRDAVAALRERGLSAEEAVLIGARRIGGAPVLEPEYAKVNGREIWLDRFLWMLAGLLLWRVVSSTSSLLAAGLLVVGFWGTGFDFGQSHWIPLAVLMGVVQLAVLGLCLASGAWLWHRNGLGEVLPRLLGWSGSAARLGVAMVVMVGGLIAISQVPHVFHALWARVLPVESYGRLSMASNVAHIAVWTLEITALVFATLLLARRRLHPPTPALLKR